jgi:hypothetical protein
MLAAPSAAAAATATSPFAPGIPVSPPPAQTATTPPVVISTPGSTSSGGLSGGGAVAIGVGAIAVLGGICFFIWRDARRRAPIHHRATVASGADGARPGHKPKPKTRKLSRAERRRRKRGRAR